MKKYKSIIIVGLVSLILILTSTMVLANNENQISEFFKGKEEKLEQASNDNIVVTSEDFKITEKDYIDYKENLVLVHKLNDISFSLQAEDIINRMIEEELLYSQAQKQDIKITDDEIKEYALQTKKAVEENSTPALNTIHIELAKKLNVSPDEYFTHPDVLKQYERMLLVGKFVEQLFDEEKLNDNYTLEDFKKELRENSKNSVDINKNLIEQK